MNIQQEIRVLNTTMELVSNFVNYEVCTFPEEKTKIIRVVRPKTLIAKRYFFILLLELIAAVNKEIITEKENGDNLIKILSKIADNPQLDTSGNTVPLKAASTEFQSWLDYKFKYDIYSSNIGTELQIELSRRDAVYLIANRCKHALTRSNGILEKITKIYSRAGTNIHPGTEILILEDIDNWLFDDFAGYHFTKLCELSINLYYGIVHYIKPIYDNSIEENNNFGYSYSIPKNVIKKESKFEFYELLNKSRNPFLPLVSTWEHLTGEY